MLSQFLGGFLGVVLALGILFALAARRFRSSRDAARETCFGEALARERLGETLPEALVERGFEWALAPLEEAVRPATEFSLSGQIVLLA